MSTYLLPRLNFSGGSVIWLVLTHIGLPIGIPLVLGLAFAGLRTLANTEVPNWHIALDAALDVAILGIGATGAIFESSAVQKAMGLERQMVTGVLIMVFGFLFAGSILVLKRFFFARMPGHPFLLCAASFLVGSLALIASSTVLVYVFDQPSFNLTTLIATLAFSVLSAAIVGAAIAGSVKLIIGTVPLPDRVAASNEIKEKIRDALADFPLGQTVDVSELLVTLDARAKEAAK